MLQDERSEQMPATQLTRREMLALSAGLLVAGCTDTAVESSPVIDVSETATPARRPNVLVYLSDSLRADHLGCYGYPLATSPNLDRIADELIIFESCRSPATWTKPSIATLYTGVSPCVHRVVTHLKQMDGIDMGQTLQADLKTLAELMRDGGGYDTALFLSNGIVNNNLGFGRGFGHYYYESEQKSDAQRETVQQWIRDRESDAPFFAFVHQMDPHGPYTPSDARYESLFGHSPGSVTSVLSADDLRLMEILAKGKSIHRETEALSAAAHEHVRNLYDTEIATVEEEFFALLQFLKSEGILDETVVLFTSDHGEAFNEHGKYLHAHEPYEEQIRVPLIIRFPGVGGTRPKDSVGLSDVFSTVLAAAGVDSPIYAQGRALLNAEGQLASTDDSPQIAWTLNTSDLAASNGSMVLGRYKLMIFGGGRRIDVYDLESDPGEQHRLEPGQGELTQSVYESLVERYEFEKSLHVELSREFGEPGWAPFNRQHLEELEALGYV